MSGGLDASAIGRVGKPFSVRVERGKIRELARATFVEGGACFADDDAPAPLTMPTAIARLTQFPGADPLSPGDLDLSRVLAAGAEFRYPQGPLRDGQRLTGHARISNWFTKEGVRGLMTFVEQTTTLIDENEQVVAEYVATMIEMPPTSTVGA